MSIINNANPGSQISLLCMIYRVISRNNGKLTVDDITMLCRPDNLSTNDNQRKKFKEELDFWMEDGHQLWRKNSDDRLCIAHVTDDSSLNSIAMLTNDALFVSRVGDLFGARTHDARDLFIYMSCILSDDRFLPNSPGVLDNSSLDNICQYLPGPPNGNERRFLLNYGLFLGYLEAVSGGSVVDPTRAVRGALPRIFDKKKTLTAKEFFFRLSTSIPLLDGGQYRQQVEEKMKSNGWINSISQNHISRSLSHALTRLQMSNVIELDGDDDDRAALYLQQPDRSITVSSLSYKENIAT